MTHVVHTAVLLATALGTMGCFDVHTAGGPWVVDDFEDGDLSPADRNFGPWACFSFSQSTADNCGIGIDPGDDSSFSLFLDFTLDGAFVTVSQQGGALFQTTTSAAPENLARFHQMVLSAKLTSTVALPSNAGVFVQLGCSSAQAADGTRPGNLYVQQPLAFTSAWQTFTLAMRDFTTLGAYPTHVLGGPAACLERIDSIGVAVSPQVPDGQSATERLDVDDIYFQ
ncbi:MAG TPA: hypothetical protein VHM31_25075 [Polyangia bacterium]|nr:hypothetical protein [Polyangia bacterium]